jgi:hypothetical protein
MRIEKENPKIRNPQSEIRNSIGRCFLRDAPLLPDHKLGSGWGQNIEDAGEQRPFLP